MLRHITLLFFVLLLAASSLQVVAQQPQPATAAASPPAVPLATFPVVPDTVAALHRLFTLRRERGYTAFKVGGALLAVSGGLVASAGNSYSYQNLGLYAGGILGIGSSVPVLAMGVIRTVNYSKKREQRAVQSWQQHQLTRQLKRALEDDSLLAAQARAQARLARAATPVVLGSAAAAEALDTAAALHRLFAKKRRILTIVLPLTTAVGAGLVVQAVARSASFGSVYSVLPGATILVLAATELATLRKYSKKREALALLALRERRLPAKQRQELQAEYFRPSKATP
ncbi:MAG: hypothetical protein ACRYF0_03990 [Janthinobacterium lividum]